MTRYTTMQVAIPRLIYVQVWLRVIPVTSEKAITSPQTIRKMYFRLFS
ncbi:MAG: hypothetical protein IKG99_02280 [Bacteroidaceae bacterium]|nr:hypothetical protein [Bacteroidaceae bacterium]